MEQNTLNRDGEFNANRLFDLLRVTGKKYDLDKIKRAYEYAKELHCGQFRQSGEPYISHPLAVAEIVAGLELDTDSICAALLHDTVEDCADKVDLGAIQKEFGQDVAMLVDGLTKIVSLQIEDKEEQHIENIRKMLLAMSKDVRVIFIKLCDRLHNMRTLEAKADHKRRLTALETMQVYAPLAHRLGIQKIKQELENLGIQYLDPIGYNEVKTEIENKYGQSLNVIESIRSVISEKMAENHIHFTLEGRIKTVYSIYKKMYNQNKSFDEIYDFYAVRVIVDTELECYTALGIIHEMFNSIPGRFKDYISTPKPNMYRSLHTTVIGRDGIPFEVQIRTKEMHHIAEYGIAAHWKYKSGASSKEEMDKKLEWISRLIETEGETQDPDEFINALKTDIFHDEVFVFTPKGDVIALPQGATVIDFAYAIHSAVGNKMIGAKINGMIVPIDRVVENGEIVEVLTSSSSKGPSRDWLNIVKTSESKSKIRQWFKKESRAENILLGRSIIDGEIKKHGVKLGDQQKNEILTTVGQRVGFNTADDMFNAVGYGGISLNKIAGKLKEEINKLAEQAAEPVLVTEQELMQKSTARPKHIKSNSGIIVDGESGCQVKFAKCCNPLPGDDVIGFITKGYGISIHKQDCPNVVEGLKKLELSDRWVEAHWEAHDVQDSSKNYYEALLQLFTEDRVGMLADVAVALADMKVAILHVNSQKRNNGRCIISLKISCKNIDHYNSIVSRLRSLDGVESVGRGFS
ncbi:MAG: bifunctional (p)ppGpp synthetase/guanosine-3',5'-bis(diphosphate) 3'-pyrophosphohydrolase [Ruminococcaceae bacterium]|nr:bifunctional (p)ppGpp synthetase/guanosine-3',5'-bis(diphosphate) 3'-pyrophosphohydrolase [Oscillospiraceae bacterium]